MKEEIRNSKVETKDGGPAFPSICDEGYLEGMAGMSLRDYFAAHCPSDLTVINVPEHKEEIAGLKPIGDWRKMVEWNNKIEAFLRYAYADAMLEARGK